MDITSIALSGLNRAQASFDRAAIRLSAGGGTTDPGDLATDTVNLLQAKNDVAIDVKAVSTADEITRHTLDLLA